MTYEQFIQYNRHKDQGQYTHKHHVVPEAWGGKSNKENLIKLSWLAHYYSHMLLVKENPDDIEMQKAFQNMGDIDSYLHRCYINENKKDKPLTDEQRKNLSNAMSGNSNKKGKKESEESRQKKSKAQKLRWAKKKAIDTGDSLC